MSVFSIGEGLVKSPDQIIAAVTDELLGSKDGVTWEGFSQGMESAAIVSLQPSPDFTNDLNVWGLTREGEVWTRTIPKP